MLKKPITYKDLNGDTVTEDFYFSYTRSELASMQLSTPGGFDAYLKRIADAKDGAAIIETFQTIIGQCYGKKSDDGKRFIKTPQLTEEFMQSPAYDVLFMELVTDADKAAEFIRGVVPADLGGKLETIGGPVSFMEVMELATDAASPTKKLSDYTAEELDALPADVFEQLMIEDGPGEPKKITDYTREELLALPIDEFKALLRLTPKPWPRLVTVIAMQRKIR